MPPAPHPSKPQATLPYLGGAIRRSMLTKFDDYAIHQTPEPIAHPASSDRNVYDRYWFNGYADDGEFYFAIGMGLYANRGIIDCGFSIVRDGEQHAFHASKRATGSRLIRQWVHFG